MPAANPDLPAAPASPAATATVLEGPAFPLLVRVLATAMMAALVVSGLMVLDDLAGARFTTEVSVFLLAVVGVIIATYVAMMRSRVRWDGERIRQSWLWTKEAVLADIVQGKVVCLPHLTWLMAPRFVVRLRGGAFMTFHVADPRVLREAAQLCVDLASVRRPPAAG